MAYKFSLKTKVKKLVLSAILLAAMASCSNQSNDNNQVTQIRIVDLNGKPKPVKSYVPEMNAKILAARGVKINEKTGDLSPINSVGGEKIAAVPTAPSAFTTPPQVSNQVPPVVQNLAPPAAATSILVSEPFPQVAPAPLPKAIAKTSAPKPAAVHNMTTSYSLVSPASSSPVAQRKNKNNKEESVEYNLVDSTPAAAPATSEVSKNKKFKMVAGKEAVKTSAVSASSEIFIQIGSYPSPEMANDFLAKTAGISAGKVEEVEVKGKKFYRAILGPIDNSKKAHNTLGKLAKAGYKDAFIVR